MVDRCWATFRRKLFQEARFDNDSKERTGDKEGIFTTWISFVKGRGSGSSRTPNYVSGFMWSTFQSIQNGSRLANATGIDWQFNHPLLHPLKEEMPLTLPLPVWLAHRVLD